MFCLCALWTASLKHSVCVRTVSFVTTDLYYLNFRGSADTFMRKVPYGGDATPDDLSCNVVVLTMIFLVLVCPSRENNMSMPTVRRKVCARRPF